jgi:hypothetical protein
MRRSERECRLGLRVAPGWRQILAAAIKAVSGMVDNRCRTAASVGQMDDGHAW